MVDGTFVVVASNRTTLLSVPVVPGPLEVSVKRKVPEPEIVSVLSVIVVVPVAETVRPEPIDKTSVFAAASPPIVSVPLTVGSDVETVTVVFVPLITRLLNVVAEAPVIAPEPVMVTVPELAVNVPLLEKSPPSEMA